MISDDAKATIDALSQEELRLEVNKGRRSRFQDDKFAYAQSRLQQLEDKAQADRHQAELAAATEANSIAKQANAIASEANDLSKKAWRISIASTVIAIVAIVVSMCAQK